ncbi:acyl-CoA dehydrogenase family protein [Streptomyces sp. NPDC054866]
MDDAHWVLLAAPTDQARAGEPTPWVGLFAVPRAAVTVRDTWNSEGLRGTGTNTATLSPTFVPEHRSVALDAVLAGEGPEHRARCHAAPAHLAGGLMFAAPALGAARAALNAWTTWAAGNSDRGALRLLGDADTQERFARTSVDIDSVELLLAKAAERADTADIGSGLVALNRRDAALGVDRLAEAVDRLFGFGGAHMRELDGDVRRRRRDILTIASHGALRREPAAAAYAQCVAGHPTAGTGPEQKVEL